MLNIFTFTKPYTRLAVKRSGSHKRKLFVISNISWQKFGRQRREPGAVFSVNAQHKKRKQVQSDSLITILVARVAHGSRRQARYRKKINTLM
ncbi:hypothetical protein [Pantoea brenneri]|uniref:hypothetical protein n=1 Tax=Pantoea brenneri TaxID=472694 RepID=UPI00289D854D|nr:hypothetical protein [Pantoea brenneri]